MQNASHLLQNEALHSKYHKHISKQTFANTFAIILIPVRLCIYFFVLHRVLCVVFRKKCFMKLKTEAEN